MTKPKKKFKLKKKTPIRKRVGGGGIHWHQLSSNPEQTEVDGAHDHLFIIGGLPYTTEWDGVHSHPVSAQANRTGPEDQQHKHKIKIRGIVQVVSSAGPHIHELQDQDTTTSGLHRHQLVVSEGEDSEEYTSLLPGDLLQAEVRKRVSLEIQSVHVSNLLFPRVEEATAFIMDRGFRSREVEKLDDGYRFRQLSRDRFKEESLKELELSNGVKAVVGVLDPEKMGDARATFDSLKDIDPSEDIMQDEQIAALARLKDTYAAMIADMKARAERFIPILNQFVDMSDEFVKNEPFQAFLTEFLESFSILQSEISRINTADFDKVATATDSETQKNFEDSIRGMEPILKSLSDLFVDSENFGNFGRMLKYNQVMFKQMILNLPLIRDEGTGKAIEKAFNNFIDIEKIDDEELEYLTLKDFSSLKIKKVEIEKLQKSESVNSILASVLKKLRPEGEVNVNLGSGEKPADYIGIDKQCHENVDLCYNLDEGIPLPAESIDKIRAVNILQFLKNENRVQIMEEVARVLKKGGVFEAEAPATEGREAFMPCYKSFWNEVVFKYFADGEEAKFEVVESSTEIDDDSKSAAVKVTMKKI
jgi:SAM-dependent methyltransferase